MKILFKHRKGVPIIRNRDRFPPNQCERFEFKFEQTIKKLLNTFIVYLCFSVMCYCIFVAIFLLRHGIW